jgi:hypothetical protein
MSKPLFVISAPVDTFSGYGARSRDLVRPIIESGKYDVKIIPQRWGATPPGFLKPENPQHKIIIDCLHKSNELPKKPDIWMQITVPNEFQAIGEYNIGVTAGIETTLCDPSWIEGINKMNLTLVSSQHAKEVFEQSQYSKVDQAGNLVASLKCTGKIEVLFEGVDIDIYNSKISREGEVSEILDTIKEKFCFLFVGHWLQGDLGHDRKDIGMLIKVFLETFKNKPFPPALILKTNGANFSILDKEEILNKINAIRGLVNGEIFPKIYLIHGELSDEEMNVLYNHPKVKAMVSFTKGEGFGRPLLEFTLSQKPVIASSYSGHLDFLKPHSILLDGEMKQIHASSVVKDMILPESKWFTVNYPKASKKLEEVFKNYNKFLEGAKKQSYLSKKEFSLEAMGTKLLNLIDEQVPKQVELVLPSLPVFKKIK